MKKIFLIALTSTTLFSCKNEEKKVEAAPEENTFVVTANMNVKEDDNFQIYYMETPGEPLDPNKYVSVSVKGKETPQDVVFKLPKDVVLADLRFDLGDNKKQKEIKLNNFKFEYLNKSFIVKDSLVDFYFGYNEQVVLDKKTGTATIKEIANQQHDPLLLAKPTLNDELVKLIK
ncbi:hypothetical protein [Flavobacterium sp.]|uniref:hypothetical protein n=1 Tax=Flavobacterium sp. TaxID=239 RepID=UPI00375331E6